PQHQAGPAGRPLLGKQRFAHRGMDTVSADQDVAARGVRMRAIAAEEVRGDAAFVLCERAKAITGVDGLIAEPFDDGLVDHALEASAMNRELRHLMPGIEPALLMPDLLAVPGQIEQLVGADAGLVEPVEQAEAGQFADRMRQRVDANAELTDGI